VCNIELPFLLAFEPYGFCIESVVSGYAAIKRLEQKLVTAVLVEYKREGMDGLRMS